MWDRLSFATGAGPGEGVTLRLGDKHIRLADVRSVERSDHAERDYQGPGRRNGPRGGNRHRGVRLTPDSRACRDGTRLSDKITMLENEGRLFSVYHNSDGLKFWVITESDHSATTVMLPEDY